MPTSQLSERTRRHVAVAFMPTTFLLLAAVSSSGRLLGPLAANTPAFAEQLQQFASDRGAALERLVQRLRSGDGEKSVRQPEFAGNWRTARSVGLDEFLEAMGVGPLKRAIAVKASQGQKLYQVGNVIHLEISDRRGTAKYKLYPDGKQHSGTGFQKLPIKQRAKWSRDGALLVEERYSQHLGGPEHGTKCSGNACPVVRSRRYVDKSGDMIVQIERTVCIPVSEAAARAVHSV